MQDNTKYQSEDFHKPHYRSIEYLESQKNPAKIKWAYKLYKKEGGTQSFAVFNSFYHLTSYNKLDYDITSSSKSRISNLLNNIAFGIACTSLFLFILIFLIHFFKGNN